MSIFHSEIMDLIKKIDKKYTINKKDMFDLLMKYESDDNFGSLTTFAQYNHPEYLIQILNSLYEAKNANDILKENSIIDIIKLSNSINEFGCFNLLDLMKTDEASYLILTFISSIKEFDKETLFTRVMMHSLSIDFDSTIAILKKYNHYVLYKRIYKLAYENLSMSINSTMSISSLTLTYINKYHYDEVDIYKYNSYI